MIFKNSCVLNAAVHTKSVFKNCVIYKISLHGRTPLKKVRKQLLYHRQNLTSRMNTFGKLRLKARLKVLVTQNVNGCDRFFDAFHRNQCRYNWISSAPIFCLKMFGKMVAKLCSNILTLSQLLKFLVNGLFKCYVLNYIDSLGIIWKKIC